MGWFQKHGEEWYENLFHQDKVECHYHSTMQFTLIYRDLDRSGTVLEPRGMHR